MQNSTPTAHVRYVYLVLDPSSWSPKCSTTIMSFIRMISKSNKGELAGANSFMREEAGVIPTPSQSPFTVLPKPSPKPQLLIIFMSRLFGACRLGLCQRYVNRDQWLIWGMTYTCTFHNTLLSGIFQCTKTWCRATL